MSRYSRTFNDHPVHSQIQQVSEQLADLPKGLRKKADDHEPQDALQRLGEVLAYVGALLGSVDPALVTEGMLNGFGGPLQQIRSGLTPLRDAEDFAQLSTIEANTESLLNSAIQIAPAVGVWARSDAKKAAASLGKAATTRTRELDAMADSLESRIGQVREQLEQASTEVKTTSEARLNEMQAQLDTLKNEAEAERARVQESINNFQTQFSSEQESRTAEFETLKGALSQASDEATQELRQQAEATANQLGEEAAKIRQDFENRANAIVEGLEEKRDEAAKLVDLVATSATAGAFGKEADAQKAEADQWRKWAIWIGVGAAVVAVAAVALSVAFDTSASLVVAKVAAVALLLGIAGYAAGQSGQHRRREQRAKRLELELIAFGPFAEPLDDPKKQEAREAFIERLFVGDPGDDDGDRDPRLSDENLSALAKLIDLLRPSSSS